MSNIVFFLRGFFFEGNIVFIVVWIVPFIIVRFFFGSGRGSNLAYMICWSYQLS